MYIFGVEFSGTVGVLGEGAAVKVVFELTGE